MSDQATLLHTYKTQTKTIEDLESEVERAKQARSTTVRTLLKECGKGPYDLDGETLIASNRGSAFFLRTNKNAPRKPKATLSAVPLETDEAEAAFAQSNN